MVIFERSSLISSSLTTLVHAMNRFFTHPSERPPAGSRHSKFNCIIRLALAKGLLGIAAATASTLGFAFDAFAEGPRVQILRQGGDDSVNTYRIPGIATTNAGTLLAVYDARHANARDLPADVDVALSRSTDGGRTWEAMKIIMDYDKNVPNSHGNGVGDPAILVDRTTGEIFVIALWSFGNRSWHGSREGMTPEETGQVVIVRSKDDGVSWSEPVNITSQIKDPKWHLVFQGPGAGIQLRDGTLVFAAQYITPDRNSHSCFIWSKDHGDRWEISSSPTTGTPKTSEAQIAELTDGSLLLSMRNETDLGQRLWAIYSFEGDIAKGQWTAPWSDVPDPRCMASLIRHPSGALLFCNPNSPRHRVGLTVRVSEDDGKTWSEGQLIDPAPSAYSCLTILQDGTIGVLYETGKKSPYENLSFTTFSLEWAKTGEN